MTAHAMAGDRERCLAAGMDAFVTKPLRPGVLVETLREAAEALPNSGGPSPAPEEDAGSLA